MRAAYDGALAHPLIPDPENLQHLTPDSLAAFVAQNYTGEGHIAAFIGDESAALVVVLVWLFVSCIWQRGFRGVQGRDREQVADNITTNNPPDRALCVLRVCASLVGVSILLPCPPLTGKRVVLAGAGLEHQQLVELAAPMLQGEGAHSLGLYCLHT